MSDIDKASAIFDKALETEKEGLRIYKEAAEKVKDEGAKEIFTILAKAEAGHVKQIEEAKGADLSIYASREWKGNFSAELAKDIENVGRLVVPKLTDEVADATALEAVDIGIKLEKAGIEFYSRARDQLNDIGAANFFGSLLATERTHLLLLEMKRDSLVYGT
jgi:rubrerythrin